MPSTIALSVDARDAFEQTHAASQPEDDGLDFDRVAGIERGDGSGRVNAGEKRKALAVFGFRENQDGADLGDRLSQNRRAEAPATRSCRRDKYRSFSDTFLMPTIRLSSSSSVMRSTSRNGYRCGRIRSMPDSRAAASDP